MHFTISAVSFQDHANSLSSLLRSNPISASNVISTQTLFTLEDSSIQILTCHKIMMCLRDTMSAKQPSLEYFTHLQYKSTDLTLVKLFHPIFMENVQDMHAHTHKYTDMHRQRCFYLMCVAGRDSNCLERKSSLCLSWCFCFSGRSSISGFSISSSSSPVGRRSRYVFIKPPADVN